MNKNMGQADRYIRFLLGTAVLLQIVIFDPGFIGILVFLVAGLLLIRSSISGYCPLYVPLKIHTCDDAQCMHRQTGAETAE